MSHYKVDRNAEILQIAVKKLELRFPIYEFSFFLSVYCTFL